MTYSDEDDVNVHRSRAQGGDAARPPRRSGDADGAPDSALERGNDVDDLDADNAVEEDMIETVDPDNAPA